MPQSVGVVDAFKNLIRHGKHHNHQPQQQQPQQQQPQQQQPQQQHASQPERQSGEQPQASHSQQRQHEHHSSPKATTPQPREAAEMIVNEEREKKQQMPIYAGLENYKLVEKMGDGAFSNVYHGIDLTTKKNVALKVVRKYELNSSQRANILKEVQIMRGLNHPSIVKLKSFSESPEHYFLVLELMEGGELFHQIVKLTYFSEDLSRHVILQVARGIRYLHEERGVVHRDIKPENLLFERIPIIPSKNPIVRPYDEEKEDEGEFIPGVGGGGIGRVKIADFGLSKVVWDEQTMTPCGTVGYTAPEIVKDERYSKSVDMWALGCVLYTLLCGFPPFYDESINVLTEKVARGYYTFLSPWWDDISNSAKDLITHLLCVDPTERYTIDQFLAHPWCSAAPAPAPPATPYVYNRPLDSPLLSAARGGRTEGRSPGVAALKEAFDVTYAVHRMEEEGARRRARGAGGRGFLQGLNEDEEAESSEDNEMEAHRTTGGSGRAGPRDQGRRRAGGARAFELDMDGATLLHRRHKRGVGEVRMSSPLAGRTDPVSVPRRELPPGSPMRL